MTNKIKKVIEAYERYTLARARYRSMSIIANQPMPGWKAAKLNPVHSKAFITMYNAQSALNGLFDKLTRKEKADLTELRKGVIH